jgi:hypothetical protein
MTTQIPAVPFDPDRTFVETVPYLASIIPPTTTTTNLRTSPFEAAPSYIPSDSTWINDYLCMIYRKLVYDQAGGSGTSTTAPDPDAGDAAVAALTATDYEKLLDDFYISIKTNPPATPLLFAQSFVTFVQGKISFPWALNTTNQNKADYYTAVSDGLMQIIAANLGIWGVEGSLYASTVLQNFSLRKNAGLTQGQRQASGPQWPITIYHPETYPPGTSLSDDDGDKFNNMFVTAPGALVNLSMFSVSDPDFTDQQKQSMLTGMVEDAFTGMMSTIPWASLNASTTVDDVVPAIEKYFARFAAVATYINVYQTFNPGFASGADGAAIVSFMKDIIANDPTGFNFSHDFGAWYTKMQKDYLVSITGDPNGIPKGVMDASFKKVAIINRIYALIAQMIGIIQKTTAAQADTLKILTVLQGEMTNLIAKTHIFTSTDGSELNDTDATASTYRDELNQVVTAWVDTIRANRDFQKSAAQSQQSNVNNSNDAVNQQASMATALIQQLSTLLGAIYR